MNWRPLLDAVLDILYPPVYCVRCGNLLQKSDLCGLCEICVEAMPFIRDPRCAKCGKPLNELKGEHKELCPDCSSCSHYFEKGLSVFEYSTIIQELIYRYKYYGEFSLARTFAYFMSELLQQSGWQVDGIIPVPLHKNRLKARGFNQSALLCDYISQWHRIPVLESVLVRQMDTRTQTGFSRAQRAKNLEDAFTVVEHERVCGKSLLIIDDIYTTGATADSCSKTLKAYGAKNVYVLTIATGRNI